MCIRDSSQATVIGVFSPELATIGKDMVVYALDGRKGDGAILSKDKAVRGRGVEPLDYGSASGEDLDVYKRQVESRLIVTARHIQVIFLTKRCSKCFASSPFPYRLRLSLIHIRCV